MLHSHRAKLTIRAAAVLSVTLAATVFPGTGANAAAWTAYENATTTFSMSQTLSTDIVDATGAAFMWYRGFQGGFLEARFKRSVDFGNCFSALSTSGCSATLQIAADDYAAIRVNGVFVGDYWLEDNFRPGGPAIPGQPGGQPMALMFDLAPFLTQDGDNLVEVYACDGSVRPIAGSPCSPASQRGNHYVWLAGGVGYNGGPDLDYVSDSSWLASGTIATHVPEPSSLALFGASLAIFGTVLRRRGNQTRGRVMAGGAEN